MCVRTWCSDPSSSTFLTKLSTKWWDNKNRCLKLKQSLHSLSTNWITYCYASLQRKWDLTLKRPQDKNNKDRISENKNLTAKTEYLNIKARSNNVKMQSDKTLTTQIYHLLTIKLMESFRGRIETKERYYVTIQQRERSMRPNSKINQHLLNQEFSKALKTISF